MVSKFSHAENSETRWEKTVRLQQRCGLPCITADVLNKFKTWLASIMCRWTDVCWVVNNTWSLSPFRSTYSLQSTPRWQATQDLDQVLLTPLPLQKMAPVLYQTCSVRCKWTGYTKYSGLPPNRPSVAAQLGKQEKRCCAHWHISRQLTSKEHNKGLKWSAVGDIN